MHRWIFSLLLLASACSSGTNGTTLIVYSPHGKELLTEFEKRFEAENTISLSWALTELGERSEVIDLLRRGYQASRETGLAYDGAWILGMLARLSDDSVEQTWALAEGEALLQTGSVSHNHLHFYQIAIDVALHRQNWTEAERYANALTAYTHAEPLPWSNFYSARGQALAAFGQGHREPALLAELKALYQEARRIGLHSALPALHSALHTTLSD